MTKGEDDYVIMRGKHQHETLTEVAEADPDYVVWMYNEVDDLTTEQREAIEEIAEKEGIDL